jgi:mRNA interferase RelE/StbE
MSGGGAYYRMRLGDHRVGLSVQDDVVTFVRVLPRKDIYRYFP